MIRGISTLFVAFLATGFFGIPATIGCMLFRKANATNVLGGAWSRVILRTAGIRIHYSGHEDLVRQTPAIFISNHQSAVDILALLPILPTGTRFVAKESLFRIPALGWAIRAAGFIPIDRSRLGKAMRSLDRAAATIQSGDSVILFPEGTRSEDGRLRPFKKGAFHLALRAQVPIVPIGIRGSFERLQPKSLITVAGDVYVRFCDPIPFDEYRNVQVDELKSRLEGVISQALRERKET
jgi:1-acyl-sn-glycerol-3-phosphate acyltransferase